MSRQLKAFLARLPALLSAPVVLAAYFSPQAGRLHGIGAGKKLGLLYKMVRNNLAIVTASNFLEHAFMAIRVWSVPPDVPGVLVECGTYKGGSAANLSLIAALCNRRLHVFDSFEGLPEPAADDKAHYLVDAREVATYEKGAWRGTLDEVTHNLERFGRRDLCELHEGYFDETLPAFNERVVFAYVDADLRTSVAACLEHLWPCLQPGAHFFTHEAPHMEVASLFFDSGWWRKHLKSEPPGLIGAGTGIGLVPMHGSFGSGIGYAVKDPDRTAFKEVPQTG